MTNEHNDNPWITASRVLNIFLLLCLIGFLGAAPCRAQRTPNWTQYNNWEMTGFDVTGVPDQWSHELNRGLALTGQWKLFGGQQRPPFSAAVLAEDLRRIRLFLAARGYPAVRVAAQAAPAVGARQLALTIVVDAGEPVRIAQINYLGLPRRVSIPDTTDFRFLAPGQVVADEAVAGSLAAVLAWLRNAGYALAQVTCELVPAGTARVLINYEIAAGDFYTIDEVIITGCSDDLKPLARRLINIPPGTEYAEELLENAALDLRLAQLFRHVELTTTESSPGHLRLDATLGNVHMRTWDAAIGTWTDNSWMVRSSWTHRNLFKGGRGFTARSSFATHEIQAGVGMFWLGWMSPRAQTRVGFDAIAMREEAYDSEEFRAEIVHSFRPRNGDILNLGSALSENVINEFVAATDNPQSQGRLWEVWVDRKWDWTDDPLFPTRGGFLKVSVTFAEPWVFSEVPYVSTQIDAASYFDLLPGLLFTGRLRLGLAEPLQDGTEILANRRFYAGGYNSHRGYSRHGLGPHDGDGNSRGGEAVMLVSGEFRLPLFWLLEGGLFLDAGNIWATDGDFRLVDFPLAVGATIGVRSPLGPLRVGYAVNVQDQVIGHSRELWHFGIGYPW